MKKKAHRPLVCSLFGHLAASPSEFAFPPTLLVCGLAYLEPEPLSGGSDQRPLFKGGGLSPERGRGPIVSAIGSFKTSLKQGHHDCCNCPSCLFSQVGGRVLGKLETFETSYLVTQQLWPRCAASGLPSSQKVTKFQELERD